MTIIVSPMDIIGITLTTILVLFLAAVWLRAALDERRARKRREHETASGR